MVILQKYLWGIIKRLYWLLPSALADPFDIAERWFKIVYTAPPYLVWVLVGIGLLIASFLTYRELYVETIKLEQESKVVIKLQPRKLDMEVFYDLRSQMYNKHGASDDNGISSDYCAGYNTDDIMKHLCLICGEPRNQRKGYGH